MPLIGDNAPSFEAVTTQGPIKFGGDAAGVEAVCQAGAQLELKTGGGFVAARFPMAGGVGVQLDGHAAGDAAHGSVAFHKAAQGRCCRPRRYCRSPGPGAGGKPAGGRCLQTGCPELRLLRCSAFSFYSFLRSIFSLTGIFSPFHSPPKPSREIDSGNFICYFINNNVHLKPNRIRLFMRRKRNMNSQNCLDAFYRNYDEENRLRSKCGMVEFITTMHFLKRFLRDFIESDIFFSNSASAGRSSTLSTLFKKALKVIPSTKVITGVLGIKTSPFCMECRKSVKDLLPSA